MKLARLLPGALFVSLMLLLCQFGLYFVAETKDTSAELRQSEEMKIKCGVEHFKSMGDIKYKKVKRVSDLLQQ